MTIIIPQKKRIKLESLEIQNTLTCCTGRSKVVQKDNQKMTK